MAKKLSLFVNQHSLEFFILVPDVGALGSYIPDFSLVLVFQELEVLLEPRLNDLSLILDDLPDGYFLISCLHLRHFGVCWVLPQQH